MTNVDDDNKQNVLQQQQQEQQQEQQQKTNLIIFSSATLTTNNKPSSSSSNVTISNPKHHQQTTFNENCSSEESTSASLSSPPLPQHVSSSTPMSPSAHPDPVLRQSDHEIRQQQNPKEDKQHCKTLIDNIIPGEKDFFHEIQELTNNKRHERSLKVEERHVQNHVNERTGPLPIFVHSIESAPSTTNVSSKPLTDADCLDTDYNNRGDCNRSIYTNPLSGTLSSHHTTSAQITTVCDDTGFDSKNIPNVESTHETPNSNTCLQSQNLNTKIDTNLSDDLTNTSVYKQQPQDVYMPLQLPCNPSGLQCTPVEYENDNPKEQKHDLQESVSSVCLHAPLIAVTDPNGFVDPSTSKSISSTSNSCGNVSHESYTKKDTLSSVAMSQQQQHSVFFEEALAAARQPLTDTYGPYVCQETDRCLDDARKRLRIALNQTWTLQKAFTDRVYDKYRICLRPAPDPNSTISAILSDPIGHDQRLKNEIAWIRDEKELEKRDHSSKILCEGASSTFMGVSDSSSIVDRSFETAYPTTSSESASDQLMYYTSGLNLVILPEDQIETDQLQGYTERGPINPATGQRYRSISLAAAVAGESILDRTRKALAIRGDRLTHDRHHLSVRIQAQSNDFNNSNTYIQANNESSLCSANPLSAISITSPVTISGIPEYSENAESTLASLAHNEDSESNVMAKASNVKMIENVPKQALKLTRCRHPAHTLSKNFFMSLNPNHDEFKSNHQSYAASTIWLQSRSKKSISSKTNHLRSKLYIQGISSDQNTKISNEQTEMIPTLPNAKNRCSVQPIEVYPSNSVHLESIHSEVKFILQQFQKDDFPGRNSLFTTNVNLLHKTTGSVTNEPLMLDENNASASMESENKDSLHSKTKSFDKKLIVSVLHAVGMLRTKPNMKADKYKSSIPFHNKDYIALWSDKWSSLKNKLDQSIEEPSYIPFTLKNLEANPTDDLSGENRSKSVRIRKRRDMHNVSTANFPISPSKPHTPEVPVIEEGKIVNIHTDDPDNILKSAIKSSIESPVIRASDIIDSDQPNCSDSQHLHKKTCNIHVMQNSDESPLCNASKCHFEHTKKCEINAHSIHEHFHDNLFSQNVNQPSANIDTYPDAPLLNTSVDYDTATPELHDDQVARLNDVSVSNADCVGSICMREDKETVDDSQDQMKEHVKSSFVEALTFENSHKQSEEISFPNCLHTSLDVKMTTKTSTVSETAPSVGGRQVDALFCDIQVPENLSEFDASLIRRGEPHHVIRLVTDPQKLTNILSYLSLLSNAVPIPRDKVDSVLKQRLQYFIKSDPVLAIATDHLDVVTSNLLVWLWAKYNNHNGSHFTETETDLTAIINLACGVAAHALCTQRLALTIGDLSQHPVLHHEDSLDQADVSMITSQAAASVMIVSTELSKVVYLDTNSIFIIPRVHDTLALVDEARYAAFRARARERTLLATLLARRTTIDETFSQAYISAMVRAGEAMGHGELFETVQNEEALASTLIPYDIFTDETGIWEDPAKPPDSYSTGITGEEFICRAHARAMLQMSLRKFQDRHHIRGGTNSYGPFIDKKEGYNSFSANETSVEKYQLTSHSPRPVLKRKVSSIAEATCPPGSGAVAARSLSVYEANFMSQPLLWDVESLKNCPYGMHLRGRKRALSGVASDFRKLKSQKIGNFSCKSDSSPSSNNSDVTGIVRSTHEIRWEDVASVFDLVKLPKKTSTLKNVAHDEKPFSSKIYAPFFRLMTNLEHSDENNSESEEDVSDNHMIERHQAVLDGMREKMSVFNDARRRQQDSRKKQESRKNRDSK